MNAETNRELMSLYFCFSLRNGITGIVKAIIEYILHICAHTHFSTYTSTHTEFPIDRLDLFGKIGTREALKTVIVLDN